MTSFGLMLMLVNNTSVSVALPELSAAFDARAGEADWFLVSYMLANTASILVFGRASDLLGRKRIYLWGMTAFMVASAGAALAPTAGVFIVLRVLQGIAAATIVSNTTAIVVDTFPPAQLARGLSINLTAAAVGNTIGPAIGGVLVSTLGWQAVFLVNVPFGIVAVVLGIRVLPASGRPAGRRERFDLSGAVLSAGGLGLVVYALNRLSSHGADAQFAAIATGGALLLAVFVLVETRVDDPLVDVGLVRDARRAGAYAATFFNAFARSGITVLVVLHQQIVGGRSAAAAGTVLTVMAVAMVATTPCLGPLSRVLTWRATSTAGGILVAVGATGLATTASRPSLLVASVWLALVGVGLGLFTTPNTASIMWEVPPDRRTVASAVRSMLYNSAQSVSTTVCLLVVATSGISSYAVQAAGPEVVRSFRLAFVACVVAALLAVLLAFARGGPWLRRDPAADRRNRTSSWRVARRSQPDLARRAAPRPRLPGARVALPVPRSPETPGGETDPDSRDDRDTPVVRVEGKS